jgi:hypothetical protein
MDGFDRTGWPRLSWFGGLSVTEIVRLAGVSRQTLYQYLDIVSDRSSNAAN